MEEGVKPSADDEIAINKIYAEKNGIDLGDIFVFNSRPYRVTGHVLFPDYTLTAFDNAFSVDTGLQVLVLMTDAAYEDVDATEGFRLAGISLTGDAVVTSFDRDRLPFVSQIVSTATNMRSGAIYDELTQGRVMALGLSIFIAAIAVIMVSIMISNLLHSERGQIGILKAMGYRRIEIALPYFVSVVSVAFVMLIMGYVLGWFYAEPLKRMYLDFYLLPAVTIDQSLTVLATAVLVPLLFFAAFSGAITLRMLKQGPLELLQPHETVTLSRLSKYVSRLLVNARVRTKFKYLHAIRSSRSFVVFFFGILFSTILITFSFMMSGMVERMTVDYLDRVAYGYQSYADLSERIPEPRVGEEKFLTFPYGYVAGRVVSLQGLSPDNVLYNLYDHTGGNITGRIRDGAVVTTSFALKFDITEGETLTVKVNDDVRDFTVTGVTDEYSGDQIYLDIRTLSTMVSDNETTRLFSGIYSTSRPSSEYYNPIISKDGLIEQSAAMSNYTDLMVTMMVAGAAVIGASIMFVLTSFTVERNYYAISLLKVLGYRRREVNGMILDSYLAYALLSNLVSIPIALTVLDQLKRLFLEEYGMVIPLELNPVDLLKGAAILVVMFFVGTWASRRRIEQIPLQEVLKTYGE